MSRNRRRHNQPSVRAPEFVGVLLFGVVLAAAVLLWDEWRHESWTLKKARVVRLSTGQKMAATANGAKNRVGYKYAVDGITYGGSWEGDWMSNAMVSAMPPGLDSLLKKTGTVEFGALIAGASRRRASGGEPLDEGLLEAAATLLSDVKALSDSDWAERVESAVGLDAVDEALKNAVATAQERPAAGTAKENGETERREGQVRDIQSTPNRLAGSPSIMIRFNPKRPGDSIVESSVDASSTLYLIAFGASVVVAVMYLGLVYPAMKRWGY